MIEFLKSCYQWVAENYSKIMMVLQSTQFASLVAAGILLWKNILSARENIDSSKKLNDTVSKNNQMSENVKSIREENKILKQQNATLVANLESFQQKFDAMMEQVSTKFENQQTIFVKKLNSIIDVQSIVYSTIRDDNTRATISGILANAKFDETVDETKQKLMDEIASLRIALSEQAEIAKNIAEEASTKLEEIVEPKTENMDTEQISILNNFKRY